MQAHQLVPSLPAHGSPPAIVFQLKLQAPQVSCAQGAQTCTAACLHRSGLRVCDASCTSQSGSMVSCPCRQAHPATALPPRAVSAAEFRQAARSCPCSTAGANDETQPFAQTPGGSRVPAAAAAHDVANSEPQAPHTLESPRQRGFHNLAGVSGPWCYPAGSEAGGGCDAPLAQWLQKRQPSRQ